jgi:hypothetical protein
VSRWLSGRGALHLSNLQQFVCNEGHAEASSGAGEAAWKRICVLRQFTNLWQVVVLVVRVYAKALSTGSAVEACDQ